MVVIRFEPQLFQSPRFFIQHIADAVGQAVHCGYQRLEFQCLRLFNGYKATISDGFGLVYDVI